MSKAMDADYIVSYLIRVRAPEEIEVLDTNYVSLIGGLDEESYHSECVSLESVDKLPFNELAKGIYRVVLAAKCESEVTFGYHGPDYDAWQTYTVLSVYQYDENQAQFIST